MKSKSHLAGNRQFNLFLLVSIPLLVAGINILADGDVSWGLLWCVLGLLMLAAAAFQPWLYRFDSEGVTAYYVFLPKERYLWKNIYAIEVNDDSTSGSRYGIWDLLFSGVFELSGPVEGMLRFYMEGHIRKSRRTKRLLETYWDGTITGYLLEDVKKWWNKRIRKKQKRIEQHLTDEIVPMERQARAKVREWLAPFIDRAGQYDLQLRTRYLYETKDGEEANSRPQEGYTYTLLVEISHPGEVNEDRIVCVSTPLLHVRLGKTAYRGVPSDHAEEELCFLLTDTLKEIEKNGIEAYCRNI